MGFRRKFWNMISWEPVILSIVVAIPILAGAHEAYPDASVWIPFALGSVMVVISGIYFGLVIS